MYIYISFEFMCVVTAKINGIFGFKKKTHVFEEF